MASAVQRSSRRSAHRALREPPPLSSRRRRAGVVHRARTAATSAAQDSLTRLWRGRCRAAPSSGRTCGTGARSKPHHIVLWPCRCRPHVAWCVLQIICCLLHGADYMLRAAASRVVRGAVCCMLHAVPLQRAEGPEGEVGVLVRREGAGGESDSALTGPVIRIDQCPSFALSAPSCALSAVPVKWEPQAPHRRQRTRRRPRRGAAQPRTVGRSACGPNACRRCSTSTSARWSCTTRRARGRTALQRSAPRCNAALQRRTTTLQLSAPGGTRLYPTAAPMGDRCQLCSRSARRCTPCTRDWPCEPSHTSRCTAMSGALHRRE